MFKKFCFILTLITAFGSLESNCPKDLFDCGNNRCIPPIWRCDGQKDCPNGVDEKSCGICPSDHFVCSKNGNCIPNKFVCDGKEDCPLGLDEKNCPKKYIHCKGFICRDKRCIDFRQKCDGIYDCSDGSDETNCSEPNNNQTCVSDFRFYKCLTGECIPREKVCDNMFDCPKSDDEGQDCQQMGCKSLNCSQMCLVSKTGPKCICGEGFVLDRNGITCSQIYRDAISSTSRPIQGHIIIEMIAIITIFSIN